LTLAAALVTTVAIAKGFVEFFYYGIEKDAYFFNLVGPCSSSRFSWRLY